jgi:negative regulator of flagellin synthesis FlgM
MKIDSAKTTIGSVQAPAGRRTTGTRPATTNIGAGSPSTGQTTTVVATALHSVSGSEAAFNSQKVAEIRQAISEGRFQINPEKIADGLISSVREMLDQNRRPA